jgi:hypothetical protein
VRRGNCESCRCVLVCCGVQSVDTSILFFLQMEAAGCYVFARPYLFFNTTVIIVRRYNTRGEGRNMAVTQGSVAAERVKGNCCFCCDGQCAVCPAPQYAEFIPGRKVCATQGCPAHCFVSMFAAQFASFALILCSTNYSCSGLINPKLKHVQSRSH